MVIGNVFQGEGMLSCKARLENTIPIPLTPESTAQPWRLTAWSAHCPLPTPHPPPKTQTIALIDTNTPSPSCPSTEPGAVAADKGFGVCWPSPGLVLGNSVSVGDKVSLTNGGLED